MPFCYFAQSDFNFESKMAYLAVICFYKHWSRDQLLKAVNMSVGNILLGMAFVINGFHNPQAQGHIHHFQRPFS